MRRIATEDIILSDGTILPKGDMVAVSLHNQWDSKVHDRPSEWDGRRFLRMRETVPGKDKLAQLVSTSQEHLAFGHGQHACPGRFFAANEIKIALIHTLLKYDWRLLPGEKPQPRFFGFSSNADPFLKVEIRRRESLDILPQDFE